MNSLSDLKVLVCGQLITSRTETIEEYLKDRVSELGVIGTAGIYAKENVSRCTLYKGGVEKKYIHVNPFFCKIKNIWPV